MTERLTSAFTALAERGTVAGAEPVWQRALLAAAVDDRGQLAEGGTTPLVPVVRAGDSDAAEWVEVRAADPFAVRRGRGRVGLAVGLSAAALLGAGVSAAVLRDGGERRDGPPGAPTDPATSLVATTAPPPEEEAAPTTFGGGFTETTFAGGPTSGFGFAISTPCTSGAEDELATPSTAPHSAPSASTEFPPTTPGVSVSGYVVACAYPDGTLPPVTDGPGSDWAAAATTLPADAELVYWRMLDDLDVTWRQEPDGTYVYWRTPAGQGGALDGIGGAAVLLLPATDRYIVLARAGTTASGSPAQRPVQVQARLGDGSLAVAPLIYDNELGLGHAYLDTTLSVVEIAAS